MRMTCRQSERASEEKTVKTSEIGRMRWKDAPRYCEERAMLERKRDGTDIVYIAIKV